MKFGLPSEKIKIKRAPPTEIQSAWYQKSPIGGPAKKSTLKKKRTPKGLKKILSAKISTAPFQMINGQPLISTSFPAHCTESQMENKHPDHSVNYSVPVLKEATTLTQAYIRIKQVISRNFHAI